MTTTIIEIDHRELARLVTNPGPLAGLLKTLQAGDASLANELRDLQAVDWCAGVRVLAQRADGELLTLEWK